MSSTDASSTSKSVSIATGSTTAATTSQQSAPSTSRAAAPPPSTSKNGGTLADLTPLGLPLYPNVFESGLISGSGLTQTSVTAGKPAMGVGQMSTHDSFDAVYAWYRERMPSGSENAAVAASNHTSAEGDRMAVFEVGTSRDPSYKRVLLIRGKADDNTIVNLVGHVGN